VGVARLFFWGPPPPPAPPPQNPKTEPAKNFFFPPPPPPKMGEKKNLSSAGKVGGVFGAEPEFLASGFSSRGGITVSNRRCDCGPGLQIWAARGMLEAQFCGNSLFGSSSWVRGWRRRSGPCTTTAGGGDFGALRSCPWACAPWPLRRIDLLVNPTKVSVNGSSPWPACALYAPTEAHNGDAGFGRRLKTEQRFGGPVTETGTGCRPD